MREKRGFTLVELLVVISIIALLLSILMPALNKVRGQARKVVCLTNAHQLTLALSMYTNDSRGKIPTYLPAQENTYKCWNYVIKPYLGWKTSVTEPVWGNNLMKSVLCPEAKGFQYANGVPTGIAAKWAAWGWLEADGGMSLPYIFKYDYGCFGINHWVEAIPDKSYWGTTNVPGASKVPFLVECMWPFTEPKETDMPPQYDGEFGIGGWGEMKRVVVNRHNGETTGVFLDLSARSIGLKELWKLKWSRKFNTTNIVSRPTFKWPVWMAKFKNYN